MKNEYVIGIKYNSHNMDQLPREMIELIAGFLFPKDFLSLRKTCRWIHTCLSRECMLRYRRKHTIATSDGKTSSFWIYGRRVDPDYNVVYFRKRCIHRNEDLPAIIKRNGTLKWYNNNVLHRENDLPAVVKPKGVSIWYVGGRIHRDGDQPAVLIYDDLGGSFAKKWYRHDILHRDNGPAIMRGYFVADPTARCADDVSNNIESADTLEWYVNGQLHCGDDLPARITKTTQEWYINGQMHRMNDQPAEIRSDGTRIWFMWGRRHRDGDKPAYIGADGQLHWYQCGELHRDIDLDLPSVIHADGTQEWFIDGVRDRKYGRPTVFYANGDCTYVRGTRFKQ